ncbi:retinoid-inducible serine carboxypeptidase-like [Hydractinia symbiolongicarpus]|uniref:retinoid-inducible serine carboxypeptidase-like n=1 Tax=Hydractinia symbiolongicarpus TaxID=13093 RepID=UPI00254D2630|nr:retinoid-inducible serine carboxypeptidase-like [Hydractinia symbiolongicarpus]
MYSVYFLTFASLFFCFVSYTDSAASFNNKNSQIPDEKWGYQTVRENAHMFWWLYGAEDKERRLDLPLVLWLQGGPGGSGVGFGNFAELGPLDINLKPRNTTWLKKANLLFVDNPVGAGFSYVTNPSAYTRNVSQIADDLFVLLSQFMTTLPVFKTIPFYIFCESYGGKMTAYFGQKLYQAIQQGQIQVNFKGVALGDSWISAVDSVITWAPYLYQYNLLDERDFQQVMNISKKTVQAVNDGRYLEATHLWSVTESMIDKFTDSVNVYNVLQHHAPPFPRQSSRRLQRLYEQHVGIYYKQSLADLMNGPIREKLQIIPNNVKWGAQSGDVFSYQSEDFMKPVIKSVDQLINYGLKVVVFQGQLDMICDTPGAELWIKKLTWPGLNNFLNARRTPLYVEGKGQQTQAFLKSYENFSLYYIMNAGHMVPTDNGEMALQMLSQIIE